MESPKSDMWFTRATPVAIAFALFALFKVVQTLYRLHFHPLSHFPGPRAAKLSRNWLWQQIRTGAPEEILEKLHRDYDTKALRTGPNQLHITDVKLYKTIYSQSNPFPKYSTFYEAFRIPHSLFAEIDATAHRQLRKLLNPLFSSSGVTKLEPVILEKTQEMGAKLRRIAEKGLAKRIEVSRMIRCVTVDVISEFAFGQTAGLLAERPNEFGAGFLDAFDLAANLPISSHYSTISSLLGKLPLSFMGKFDPVMGEMDRLLRFVGVSYRAYTKRTTMAKHPVVFDFLKGVPEQLQTAEAMDILIAGSDTTAHTVAVAVWNILHRPDIRDRLTKDVREGIQDAEGLASFRELDRIEYLHACVKEALRVAMPVAGVLPRVVPKRPQPFEVDGKVVPPGTIVGMSAYTMNFSEELWGKDAKSFNPDRWLRPDGKHLDSYMCTFSKGARQCIGINVAHTEATMVLAYLFRNFHMELQTTEGFRIRDIFTPQIVDPGILVDFTPLYFVRH